MRSSGSTLETHPERKIQPVDADVFTLGQDIHEIERRFSEKVIADVETNSCRERKREIRRLDQELAHFVRNLIGDVVAAIEKREPGGIDLGRAEFYLQVG